MSNRTDPSQPGQDQPNPITQPKANETAPYPIARRPLTEDMDTRHTQRHKTSHEIHPTHSIDTVFKTMQRNTLKANKTHQRPYHNTNIYTAHTTHTAKVNNQQQEQSTKIKDKTQPTKHKTQNTNLQTTTDPKQFFKGKKKHSRYKTKKAKFGIQNTTKYKIPNTIGQNKTPFKGGKNKHTPALTHQLAVPGELPGEAGLRHHLVSSVHKASQIIAVAPTAVTSSSAAAAAGVKRRSGDGAVRDPSDHGPHDLQFVRLSAGRRTIKTYQVYDNGQDITRKKNKNVKKKWKNILV